MLKAEQLNGDFTRSFPKVGRHKNYFKKILGMGAFLSVISETDFALINFNSIARFQRNCNWSTVKLWSYFWQFSTSESDCPWNWKVDANIFKVTLVLFQQQLWFEYWEYFNLLYIMSCQYRYWNKYWANFLRIRNNWNKWSYLSFMITVGNFFWAKCLQPLKIFHLNLKTIQNSKNSFPLQWIVVN